MAGAKKCCENITNYHIQKINIYFSCYKKNVRGALSVMQVFCLRKRWRVISNLRECRSKQNFQCFVTAKT